MFDKLNALLDEFAGYGVPFYDCSVWHHGKEVFRRRYGFSDYEKTKPIDGSERYNIYSCSKVITVSAALSLFEKGLFSLDDPLSRYLPEYANMTVKDGDSVRPAKTPILIRDLFRMTAGFSYNLSSPGLIQAREETNGRCPTREAIRYLAQDPLDFDPGERYSYSLCHDVLAALVEELSGMRFGEYVKKTIFDPLGMEKTTFLLDDSELDCIAAQYSFKPDTKEYKNCGKRNPYKLGSEYESGGAGCITSVDDYIKFLEALRIGGVILKNETIELMSTQMLTPEQNNHFYLKSNGYGYGLGVRCPAVKDGNPPTDFGWGGAAGAYLACDRHNDSTFYYAQQVLASPIQSLRVKLIEAYQDGLEK